uniref:Expansin-like CBD domain-containing protein n=1 Tax=Picea sitchensis TaxID=3332 RepID=D5ADT4_PICSI|nr:unknown [Picea sitchensis]
MQQTWGANWSLNSDPLQAPFSIRLKCLSTGRTLTANNVIPQNWQSTMNNKLILCSL